MFSKEGHYGMIRSMVFSNDSKYILTASNDGYFAIWTNDIGEEPVVLNGINNTNNRFNFAKYIDDDSYVLTGSDDGTSRLWSSSNGEECFVFDCSKGFAQAVDVNVIDAIFNKSSDCVLTYSENHVSPTECYWSVRLWSKTTQKNVAAIDNCLGKPSFIRLSPDGQYIYFVNGKNLNVYDIFKNTIIDSLVFDADVTAFTQKNSIIGLGDKLGGVHMCRFQR